MFETTDRGQVGIGTLIVFIAMVLVAAIAAGVLINTAGLLQTQAEATGEETQQQVSDRIQIQSATGNVTEDGDGDGVVDTFNLTLTKSPGAGDIQLENVSYQLVTDDEVAQGVLSDDEITIGDITAETDDNVITDRADRYDVEFNLTADGADDDEVILGGDLSEDALEGGERVSLTLTTAQGATTRSELRVPDSLVDREAVTL